MWIAEQELLFLKPFVLLRLFQKVELNLPSISLSLPLSMYACVLDIRTNNRKIFQLYSSGHALFCEFIEILFKTKLICEQAQKVVFFQYNT